MLTKLTRKFYYLFFIPGITGFATSAIAQDKVAESAEAIELIGVGGLDGNLRDLTSDASLLQGDVPANLLGGFSALEYSGQDDIYWILPDRGAADGATTYKCRMHQAKLIFDRDAKKITAELLRTIPLIYPGHGAFTGSLKAWDCDDSKTRLALDPEGIRQTSQGQLLISDEYGPSLRLFNQNGELVENYNVPESLLLRTLDEEIDTKIGIQPNKGFEGLAIDSAGDEILAVLQGPLCQDSAFSNNKRKGHFARVLWTNYKTGETKQFAYPLDTPKTGLSEILLVSSGRYLVIERDSDAGVEAKYKRIYLMDCADATDISDLSAIPDAKLPDGVKPVGKRLLIDLLDPAYGFSGEKALEKPEGLTWGEDQPSGNKTLIVCFDNDFESHRTSVIMAFAIPKSLTTGVSTDKLLSN